jgi:DNA-binding transcriptional LysR family regulator
MELRHFKYFLAVAEELHFSRAANRLNIAQPPLSQQIHQLENELGVKLFYRTKRKVELTSSGEVFLKYIYKIFNDIEKACDSAKRAYRGEIGNLILGIIETAIFDILPNLMQSYRTKYPFIDITVLQLNSTDQVRALLKGDINIGIICAPVENSDLEFEVICQEPFIVALPENHPLALKTSSIEVQELSSELFIMTPRNSGQIYYDIIINICQYVGFSPNIVQEVHELPTTLSLVAAGIGIALVPYSIQNLHVNGVVYRQLKNSIPVLNTALAWRKDKRSPIVHNFLNLAKDIFAQFKLK